MKMIKNKILCEPEFEQKTAGGIFLPESQWKVKDTAIVLEAGPECKVVKKGDRVIYMKNAGYPFHTEDNEKRFVFEERDIQAVVED